MADGGDDVGRPTVVGMPAERGSSASRSRAAVDHESGRFTRCARALTTATCCRAPCQPIHAEASSRSLAKHSERTQAHDDHANLAGPILKAPPTVSQVLVSGQVSRGGALRAP